MNKTIKYIIIGFIIGFVFNIFTTHLAADSKEDGEMFEKGSMFNPLYVKIVN